MECSHFGLALSGRNPYHIYYMVLDQFDQYCMSRVNTQLKAKDTPNKTMTYMLVKYELFNLHTPAIINTCSSTSAVFKWKSALPFWTCMAEC